jgi:hypothetical protein
MALNAPELGLTEQGRQAIIQVRNYIVDVVEPRILREKEEKHAAHDAKTARNRAASLEQLQAMFQRLRNNEAPSQQYEGIGSDTGETETGVPFEAESQLAQGESPEAAEGEGESGFEYADPNGRFYIAIDGDDSESIQRLREYVQRFIEENLG